MEEPVEALIKVFHSVWIQKLLEPFFSHEIIIKIIKDIRKICLNCIS